MCAIGSEVVRSDSFLDRLAGVGWVVWFYLGKALWPVDLTFVYPRWEIDAGTWQAHLPNLALILVLAVAWKFRRRWGRAVLFALVYFVVMLAPVLGFLDIYFMLYSFVADHYQYLAIIGPIALFAAALTKGLEHSGGITQGALQGAAVALPFLLAFLTWQQTHIYHDPVALWRDTLRKNPEAWLAHHNLGHLLRDQGELDEAARHFQEVLRIRPNDAWAHHELATVHQSKGRFAEAFHHYQQALLHDRSLAQTHYNLGTLAQEQGDFAKAIRHYRDALAIRPHFAAAHNNLGTALRIIGQPAEAQKHFRKALELEPTHIEAIRNLKELLRQPKDPKPTPFQPGPDSLRDD